MITEGLGIRAPSPVKQRLDITDMRVVYQATRKISRYRGYGNSNSEWKRGFVSPLYINGLGEIPADHAPRFIGLCAEAAVVLFLNRRANTRLSLDDRLKHGGDGDVDLLVHKMTIQIKSRQADSKHARSKISLVRFSNDRGRVVFPKSTALIFCETFVAARLVNLLGWMYSLDAKKLPVVAARRGSHKNIEVPDSQIQPMQSLIDLVSARRELLP